MERRLYWVHIALLSFTVLLVLPAAHAQDATAGKQQFISHCAACHGEDAHGGPMGPNIVDVANPRATNAPAVHNIIRSGIPAEGMPSFTMLTDKQVDDLVAYVMAMKAPARPANQPTTPVVASGDVHAGFEFYMHAGNCGSCHGIRGRGGIIGPDLDNVGAVRSIPELEQVLRNPGSLPAIPVNGRRRSSGGGGEDGPVVVSYAAATVVLKDGHTIRGALWNETPYDLQLMGLDNHLYLLSKDQVTSVTHDSQSLMPPVQGTSDQIQNLVAYLSSLRGENTASSTPLPPQKVGPGVSLAEVNHPEEGTWPSYNGNIGGNRYSPLKEINTSNISQLLPRWMWTMPGTRRALEDTPQVIDGIMYVTGSNECFALDARNGHVIWHYSRPRTKDLVPTGDAITGINRGVAILGDRVFMDTDNAHLIALNRYTGQLIWDTEMVDSHLNYGTTQAPLVVGDLVVSGISGGDEGIRGEISAYKTSTGEFVWRFWTSPLPGEPGSETWIGTSLNHPGASTWMTGTYDPESDILYWGVGSPGPDFNGDQRKGINLYGCAIVALNPHTGKLIWYHQQTLHGTNDWDATQTPMLVDADFQGKPRKLVMQANRNGFFYVLDRLTGEFLTGQAFVHNINWASGLDKQGHPIIIHDPAPTYEGNHICPTAGGATNFPSASYDPQTAQFLVFATESCTIYVKNDEPFEIGKSFYQGTSRRSPGDTTGKFLRALDIQTGKIVWEIPNIGGGPLASGLMTTAGGFVFYADNNGTITAADVKNGKILWHFDASGQRIESSPMAYTVGGKERLVLIVGQTVLSFGIQ